MLGTALAGCSEDESGREKNYSVPDSLCGVAVSPTLLEPFLPSGDQVSSKRTFPNGGTEECALIVDKKKVAIIAQQEWWNEKDDPLEKSTFYIRRKPHHVTEDNRYVYSGIGAVGKTKDCADATHPQQRLFTIIQSFAPDREDARTMKKLIKAYTKQVEQSKACHPKPPKRPQPSAS